MPEPLSLTNADAEDLRAARGVFDPLHAALESWYVADGLDRWRSELLDIERLHDLSRDLANRLARIKRRRAKRSEARTRRGSVLEG